MRFDSVRRAVDAMGAGRMVILVDDEDRENEGDLCFAADKVTPEAINFMARYGRGLICLTLTGQRLDALKIPLMVTDNSSSYGTAFAVSVEARHGVSTGISARDRATTIRALVNPATQPEDVVRPGHMFPLRARAGGVLERQGQTEGSVDLARLAGLQPAGVICEIMKDDGTMARRTDLERFAHQHQLPMVTIADLVSYRLAHEPWLRRLACQSIWHPQHGALTLYAYGDPLGRRQDAALVKGELQADQAPWVQFHRGHALSCAWLDRLMTPPAGWQEALEHMQETAAFVLVCLDREEAAPTLAHRLQHGDADAGAAPWASLKGWERSLGLGAQILRDLGLTRIRLGTSERGLPMDWQAHGLYVDADAQIRG